MSQRSRRSFPAAIRFHRQPGAAVRQQRRRFRQHRTRERRRVNHVGHAHGASLRVHRVDRDVDRHPLGAVGYSLSVGVCYLGCHGCAGWMLSSSAASVMSSK